MSNSKLQQLEQQMSVLKQQMLETGMSKGLLHSETIKLSQQLDKLITQYMELKNK